jgi:hypothetical protein
MSTSPWKQSTGRSSVSGERAGATWAFQFCQKTIEEFGLLLVADCQIRGPVAGLRKPEFGARCVGPIEDRCPAIVRGKAIAQFDDNSGKSRRVPLMYLLRP